jgi:hypothetical protein
MSEFRADRSSNMTIIGSSCDLPIRKDLLYGKLIDASCKIYLYFTKLFQRRFLEIDQSEKKRIAYDEYVC